MRTGVRSELAGGEFFSGVDFFPDDARAVFRD